MFDSAFHSGDSIQGSPDIGATVTGIDPSRKYRAAVEVHGCGVSPKGLVRMWTNWRNSPNLVFILHGYLMLTDMYNDSWHEIDFLVDVLRCENEN